MDYGIIGTAVLAAYLGAINVVTFHAYRLDKLQAAGRARRTPEQVLFALTAAGGTLGALAARWLFRHKTKKASFRVQFWIIAAAQAALAADLFWWARDRAG